MMAQPGGLAITGVRGTPACDTCCGAVDDDDQRSDDERAGVDVVDPAPEHFLAVVHRLPEVPVHPHVNAPKSDRQDQCGSRRPGGACAGGFGPQSKHHKHGGRMMNKVERVAAFAHVYSSGTVRGGISILTASRTSSAADARQPIAQP
jgi:hypothetical protein